MANKEEIQIKIDAAVNSAEAAKSLGQLRRSLLEIQTLQAELGETSGAQFEKLSTAATNASSKLAQTRDAIGDIQDKTRTLEGTPVERLTGSFGLLRESVMNLDFDKAKIGAEGLLNTFTPVVDGKLVTGFAGIKGSISMLTDGVKSLGSTFMSVGKALLTNPIFLLAAAIIAIVAVIILIMDKLGILKKIMDALGYAINLVVKAFEALTDWLGLTTNAQEENAKAAKKNGEEQRKQIDATAKAQKDLAKLTEGLTQAEVDALKKKAGIKDALNKNSFDIEKNRLIQTQATLQNEINALEELKAAGGELTDEQLKDLEQRKTDYETNAEAIKQIEYQKIAYIQKLNQDLTTTLEGWKVKNMANDVERAKAQAQLDKDTEIRKMNAIMREAQLLGDVSAYQKAAQIKVEIEKAYQNDIDKINKDVAQKQEGERKKVADKKKADAAKGITQVEEALDKELEVIRKNFNEQIALGGDVVALEIKRANEELEAKRVAINKTTQYRKDHMLELGFIDKNTAAQRKVATERINALELKALNDLNEEKAAIESKSLDKYYNDQLKKQEFAIQTADAEYKAALTSNLSKKELDDARAKYEYEVFQAGINQIILRGKIEVEAAQGNADEIALIKEKQRLEIASFEALNNKDFLDAQAFESEILLSKLQYNYENELNYNRSSIKSTKEKAEELKALNDAEIIALNDAKNAELADLDLTELEKADIKEKYRQLDLERKARATEREIELNQRAWKNGVELAQKGNQMAQSLSDALFAFKSRNADKDLAKQKKNAEDQFKVNKALQISTAIITGIQSVMAAFANGMKNPIPLLGPATAGVYAAIAGITAAANVAKIASTKFDSSSFTPTDTGGTPATPDGGTPPAPTNFQPNQFFGLGQQTAVGMPGGPKPIKVYVTESDITGMQEQVSVIETRARLN